MPQLILPPGFIILNKPSGVSSHSCIRTIKRFLPAKTRIGHGGALDPLAKGILLIGIKRKATTHLAIGLILGKTYTVRVHMGIATESLDKEGPIFATARVPTLTETQLQQATEKLKGMISQTPPIYSALKHEGKSLCRYARDGDLTQKELEVIVAEKTRLIQVYYINTKLLEPPFFEFTAHVSKGTYVRSLAQSILENLGTIGTVDSIFRTEVGPFGLEQSVTLDVLSSPIKLKEKLITVPDFLAGIKDSGSEINRHTIDN